jgi:hypothetical protein
MDPATVYKLLRESLAIQTNESVNGYHIQQITGWEYGFGQQEGYGYQWMDTSHILLYPRTGEDLFTIPGGSSARGDISSQPVVLNLETGQFWLPRSNTPTSIYFSSELGMVFLQELYGSGYGPTEKAVFTYTFDGQEISHYWGQILGVSPQGTKILVDDDTVIDLKNNEVIDLAWHTDYDFQTPDSANHYWSSDETRLYRCCFYFADLKTGTSYNLEWNDLRGVDGYPISFTLNSPHVDGQWVRNDSYFFPLWDYWSYAGDPTIIFSPSEKKYFFIKIPDTPSVINPETKTFEISPDGMQVWIKGYGDDGEYHNFLTDLTTLKTVSYDIAIDTLVWSSDGKFGWAIGIEPGKSYLLSVASQKLEPFQVDPRYDVASWHPKEDVLAYFTDNDQTFVLLTAKDMKMQEWKLPISVSSSYWSPSGDRMAFVSTDGSIWQGEYPEFQNLEQLTEQRPDVRDLFWSPDGDYISFISGSDIYIVDTNKP